MSKGKGHTLVELIVAVGLFSLMVAISFSTLWASINISRQADKMRNVQNEARDIMDYIRRDIQDPDLTDFVIQWRYENPTAPGTFLDRDRIYLKFLRTDGSTSWHEYNFEQVGATNSYNINFKPDCLCQTVRINTDNIRVEKIDISKHFIEPRVNLSTATYPVGLDNYVVFENMRFVSTAPGKTYKFTVNTAIAR